MGVLAKQLQNALGERPAPLGASGGRVGSTRGVEVGLCTRVRQTGGAMQTVDVENWRDGEVGITTSPAFSIAAPLGETAAGVEPSEAQGYPAGPVLASGTIAL